MVTWDDLRATLINELFDAWHTIHPEPTDLDEATALVDKLIAEVRADERRMHHIAPIEGE